jgi:hypothetical protein
MYNQDAVVVEDGDMGSTLSGCLGLLEVAEKTRAVRIVSPVIEHALLRRGQILYQSIQSNPIAWSDLAMRIKSGRLFEESIIHLVGQWQMLNTREKNNLSPEVLALCKHKHSELKTLKKTIDVSLLGLYPTDLLTPPDETPGRNKYSSKIYLWMALCYFRQWLSQSLAEGQGWPAADGGASLYRKIAAAHTAYLDPTAMQNFHRYFPMSHKAQCCLEDRMARIKQEARPLVAALMRDESQLDQRLTPLEYLTCCKVRRADYPWNTPAPAPAPAPVPAAAVSEDKTPSCRSRSRSRSPMPRSAVDPRLRDI